MSKQVLFYLKNQSSTCLDTNNLFNLYLPVIGPNALSLYGLLYNFSLQQKLQSLCLTGDLFCKYLNCSYEQFVQYRQKLEAVGLIKTYQNGSNELFTIVLFPPKNYLDFMSVNDFALYLTNQLTKDNLNMLNYLYDDLSLEHNLIDISNVDHHCLLKDNKMNFDEMMKKIINQLQDENYLPIVLNQEIKQILFHYYQQFNLSFVVLKNAINSALFIDQEQLICSSAKLIEQLDLAYQINTNPSIDLHRCKDIFLKDQIDQYDQVLADYEKIDSYAYVQAIFHGNLSDKINHTIQILQTKFLLPNNIINVIIDFSLYQTYGNFNEKYILKTASTFQGLNINSTKKAIEYLHNFLLGKRYLPKNLSLDEQPKTDQNCSSLINAIYE